MEIAVGYERAQEEFAWLFAAAGDAGATVIIKGPPGADDVAMISADKLWSLEEVVERLMPEALRRRPASRT